MSEAPVLEVRGARDGPRVALLAGVQGCAYSSIGAALRVVTRLDPGELSGSIVAAPVASVRAFEQRSPHADGPSVDAIVSKLSAAADLLVELRSGGPAEAFAPCAGYAPGFEAAAVAAGLRYVGPLERPAAAGVVASAGGRGQLEEAAVRALAGATRDVLRHLGMLPGAPPTAEQLRIGRVHRQRARRAGWWTAAVHLGEEVVEGTLLGRVRDLRGSVLNDVRSPLDGVVLELTTSPAVTAGGALLALGVELEPISR